MTYLESIGVSSKELSKLIEDAIDAYEFENGELDVTSYGKVCSIVVSELRDRCNEIIQDSKPRLLLDCYDLVEKRKEKI